MKKMRVRVSGMIRIHRKLANDTMGRGFLFRRRSLMAVMLSFMMTMAFFPLEAVADGRDQSPVGTMRFPVIPESPEAGSESALQVYSDPGTDAYHGYLVKMKDELTEDELERTGCEPLGDGLYYTEMVEDIEKLFTLGTMEYYEPNYSLSVQSVEESYIPEEWNLQSVDVAAAWRHRDSQENRDRLGNSVIVAVVDSGVMAEHPDLENVSILDTIALSSEEDGLDDYHGTFIAGLLAAEVNNGRGIDGMVPEVTILPVCITSRGGKTDVKTAVEGIRTAVDMGADVISFSVSGTSDNQSLHNICEYAASKGVILVTCAGNYSAGYQKSSSNYKYPAAYDCVVSVSACKQEGQEVVFDESYSYFNDAVTVSAPGTDIRSLYLDGDVATRTGTSFAAPMVAALAVMAKQADSSIDRDEFVRLLQESAVDLGQPGYDEYYGYGYIHVPSFLEALDEWQVEKNENQEPGSEHLYFTVDSTVPVGSSWYVVEYEKNGKMVRVIASGNTAAGQKYVTAGRVEEYEGMNLKCFFVDPATYEPVGEAKTS